MSSMPNDRRVVLEPTSPESSRTANIRPIEIVWIATFFFLLALYLEGTERKTAPPMRYAVEGCIAQFGPGEYHRKPDLKCAPMVEAPVTAMTRPIK